MSLIRETTPEAAARFNESPRAHRSNAELAIRVAVEEWGRAKWPGARVVHELVMDRGNVRADMAFVGTDHFVSVEIKGMFDVSHRLIHQVAMFRVASPEIWVVADEKFDDDVDLIGHLLPSVARAAVRRDGEPVGRHGFDRAVTGIEEIGQPGEFAPIPRAMLALLWAEELYEETLRHRLIMKRTSKRPAHRKLIDLMLRLEPAEQVAAVCRQLRARNAFWRADPPIIE